MNDRRLRPAALLALAALAPLQGCQNPFVTEASDYGPRVAPGRVRTVDSLALPQRPDEGKTPEEAIAEGLDRFRQLEKMEITLEQVRAWTLHNNLDLSVALVDPSISATRVGEEEARWEATFFANLRHTSLDTPTATTLEGSQIDNTNASFGVRVPMRTGGEVSVELPFNRTETNNPFTFLNPSYSSDARISISQPLLRGAGRRANMHFLVVAALEDDITNARTKLEVIRQIANADRAYWRLYATQRALEVALQQLDLANAQLERANRRVRAGQDPEVEVTRAQSGVATRLEDIFARGNDVRTAERDLKRIVNVPELPMEGATKLIPVTSPDPLRYNIDPVGLSQTAVANRMEMLELELRLSIDESEIAFQKNQALPLFSVDYTYTINGLGSSFNQSLRVARDGDFADWSLGLRAEIPIGNEAAKSRVARAILIRLQRLGSRDARKSAIVQETLDAVDRIEANWQRILSARQAAILSGRTLSAEQRQFDIGARTSTEVLDAATRLADAQLSEIRAIADYQISQVDLAFATGTLLGAARVSWEPSDPRERSTPPGEYLRTGPGAGAN